MVINLLTKIQLIIEMHGIFFSAIIGVILMFSKQRVYRGGRILATAIFLNMVLLACDMATWLADGSNNIWGVFLLRFANYSVFLLEFMLVIIITYYIYSIVEISNPQYPDTNKKIISAIMLLDTLLLFSNFFTGIFFTFDSHNIYHRSDFFWISMGLAGVALCFIGRILFDNWTNLPANDRMEIVIFLVCPTLGALIQLFVYGVSLVNIGITISVFTAFVAYMLRLNKFMKERDLTILKSQAYLLNSQIKPHFLFNSLNVIQSLIEEDPDAAVVAVNRFSKFLRAGLKIEVMDSMVPVKTELNYVDDYLYLEILRHGEKIKVVRQYDTDLDFKIPFLTLQPIVENAVRHGICKRIKGGIIRIQIKEVSDGHEIRIIDDGIGYLPIEKEEKEWDPSEITASGVGVVNVKNRLAMMCGGTLEIDSVPGVGTTVIIKIPEK